MTRRFTWVSYLDSVSKKMLNSWKSDRRGTEDDDDDENENESENDDHVVPVLPRRHSLLPSGVDRHRFRSRRCRDLSQYVDTISKISEIQHLLGCLVEPLDEAVSSTFVEDEVEKDVALLRNDVMEWFNSSTRYALFFTPIFLF